MDASYEFLRAARALLGMTNVNLAEKAGVSKRSLVRIEAGETVRPEIRKRVQAVFEEAGITFIPDDRVSGPGMRVWRDIIQKGN
ncbi:helix-turn-helix transcriptional regulator [Mesorhizobium sp. A556]